MACEVVTDVTNVVFVVSVGEVARRSNHSRTSIENDKSLQVFANSTTRAISCAHE